MWHFILLLNRLRDLVCFNSFGRVFDILEPLVKIIFILPMHDLKFSKFSLFLVLYLSLSLFVTKLPSNDCGYIFNTRTLLHPSYIDQRYALFYIKVNNGFGRHNMDYLKLFLWLVCTIWTLYLYIHWSHYPLKAGHSF